MRRIYSAVALIGVALFLCKSTKGFAVDAVQPVPLQNSAPFEVEEELKPRVLFWVDIYTRYHSWETVLHDQRYPWVVYSVVEGRNPNAKPSSKKTKSISGERARILKLLKNLQTKADEIARGQKKIDSLNAEERNIYDAFAFTQEAQKFLKAADPKRLRGQQGLKDSLLDSIYISGRYLPRMKRMFQQFSLPEEIAYLPFVESGFNKKAVSKVGASGIWQFMPYTGKLFLRVDEVVDERNDPMRAAEAAARLMTQNHKMLKEWPLAITAYNHGAVGVMNAVKETGSKSLAKIIEKYEGRSFGFASENFYACFLAALHVTKNYESYLGKLDKAKILEFDEFVMPHFMDISIFLKHTGIELTEFKDLNPGLTKLVYENKRYIPVGYTIRVPISARDTLLAKYDQIPLEHKFTEQKVDLSADPSASSPDLLEEEKQRALSAP